MWKSTMFSRSLFLVDMNYGRAIMGQKRFFALPTTTEQKDVMDREKLRKKAAKDPKNRWQLAASVLVERKPILVPEMTPIQSNMVDTLLQIENETSLKNDHELSQEEDLKREELKKKGVENLEEILAAAPLKTTMELEHEWKQEKADFPLQPRRTEADEQNDLKSTNRCLDRPLRLLVKQKYGPDSHWNLPTAFWDEENEKSLRETAERALKQCCGQKVNAFILGNVPWAFYKHGYSKRLSEELGYCGKKVFLFKAYFNGGTVETQSDITEDFKWALIEEIESAVDSRTFAAVDAMIEDESP